MLSRGVDSSEVILGDVCVNRFDDFGPVGGTAILGGRLPQLFSGTVMN